MEVLELFGTGEHKEKWLKPLRAEEIASAFAMTEPAAASSDATNVELAMFPGAHLVAGAAFKRHCGMAPTRFPA